MNKIRFIFKSGKSFTVDMCDSEFLRLVNLLDKIFVPKTIILDDIGIIYTKEIAAVLKEG